MLYCVVKRAKVYVEEEIQSLFENGTWKKILLPDGAKLVSKKWVFDI